MIYAKNTLVLQINNIIKTSNSIIIKFSVLINSGNNLAFKNFYYRVLPLLFTKDKIIAKKIYADMDYIIIIINRNFVSKGLKVRKLFTKIFIQSFKSKIITIEKA